MAQQSSISKILTIAAAAVPLSLATLPGCEERNSAPVPATPVSGGSDKQLNSKTEKIEEQRKPFSPPKDSLDTNQMNATIVRGQFIASAQPFVKQVLDLEKDVKDGKLKPTDKQLETLRELSRSAQLFGDIISYCANSNPNKDAKYNPALGENAPLQILKRDLKVLKEFVREVK